MNPPDVELWKPTPAVRADLVAHSVALTRIVANITQSAIHYGTPGGPAKEVPTLAWFFVYGLPLLEAEWNATLTSTSVQFKGVFCHHEGSSGPLVHNAALTGNRELADLLFIVSCDDTPAADPFANAVFFQTKRKRSLGGPSTKEQRQIYEELSTFEFIDPAIDQPSLDVPAPAVERRREIPEARERGLKFWFLEGRTPVALHPMIAWPHSPPPTTSEHPLIKYPQFDQLFAVTFLRTVLGLDGLGLTQLQPGDYGWNRIVRDALVTSIGQAVSATTVVPPGQPRIQPDLSGPDLLKLLINDDLTVIRNPFTELFNKFGRDDVLPQLFRRLQERARGGEPPTDQDRAYRNRAGGNMAFIWVRLSSREKPSG